MKKALGERFNFQGEGRIEPLLDLVGLKKSFGGREVLRGLDLSVEEGALCGLVGGNGAGKSTIFNLISGFMRPNEGKIVFEGVDITGWRPARIAEIGVGRTFQEVRIFGELSLFDNLLVGCEGNSLGFGRSAVARRRCMEVAEQLRLRQLSVRANELSYAEQKVASVARAVVRQPKVLLLDEPASGLDEGGRERLAGVIKEVHGGGMTVIVVEHNLHFVGDVCQEMVFLDEGIVRARGAPDVVMSDPNLAAAYFGAGDVVTDGGE